MTSDPDAPSTGDDVDGVTLFVRRTGVPTEPLGDDDADQEFADATRGSRRATTMGEPGIHQPANDLDADTGSTMVVRRESRRRAEAAARVGESDLDVTVVGVGVRPLPATVAGDVPGALGRRAHSPRPTDTISDARSTRPPVVAVERAPRPSHSPQTPVDGVAAEAVARRRERRRAVTVVVAASIVLIAAVAVVIVLAFAG